MLRMTGLVITPMALGNSGHKSLTSNTNGLRRNHLAKIPGILAVSGVVVAKTTSYFSESATLTDFKAKLKNNFTRFKNDSLFEYGNSNSMISMPSTVPRRTP